MLSAVRIRKNRRKAYVCFRQSKSKTIVPIYIGVLVSPFLQRSSVRRICFRKKRRCRCESLQIPIVHSRFERGLITNISVAIFHKIKSTGLCHFRHPFFLHVFFPVAGISLRATAYIDIIPRGIDGYPRFVGKAQPEQTCQHGL